MPKTNRQLTSPAKKQISNELLSAIFSRYRTLSADAGLSENISALLEEIGHITQVSRVWIFQVLELTDDHILQDYVFEWAADPQFIQIELPRFNHFISDFTDPEYTALIQSRQQGEFQSAVTSALPPGSLKQSLESQSILSMLTIPLMVENQWWGVLGLDDCQNERSWSEPELAMMQMASFLIASLITDDRLRTKKRQIDIIKQNMRCSTWEFDIRRNLCWCTTEIIGLTRYTLNTSQTFTGWEWCRKIYPQDRKKLFAAIRPFLQGKALALRCDIRISRADNSYCWVEISANAEQNFVFSNRLIAGIIWDISERKAEEERLIQAAYTDQLTQVFNRRKFEMLLADFRSEVPSEFSSLTLLIIDIDHFKTINDQYGHIAGDEVLRHFCRLAQQALLPEHHYISRIGGDEFAVLLPGCPTEKAASIGQHICEKVTKSPLIYQGLHVRYSVSIGCTELDLRNPDTQALFTQADKMLYQAKHTGRNKVMY